MSIQLDLEDHITFERPLTRIVRQNVVIHNPHNRPVAFKVKTTAPKLYCVRPNSDIIRPNESVDIQIMLQAFKEEPPLDTKCRDKFLILSTFLNEVTEAMDLHDLWAYVEEKEKATIHQRKLRCLYVSPNSTVAEQPVERSPPVINKPIQRNDVSEPSAPAPVPVPAAPVVPSASNEEDVKQKMKRMEEELDRYKQQVKELRESPNEKSIQTTGYPISLFILLALFIAAVAYFVQFSK
ncbi:PapD-like protein [Choanephora cucurbitarum]|nr:PapD-like protein [Choanephora cucurbitarum]